MATKLSLEQVLTQFPGAWEEEIRDLSPEEVTDIHDALNEGESEYWEADGKLFSRAWWTAYGWHYGEWIPAENCWACPMTGETVCPWTGKEE